MTATRTHKVLFSFFHRRSVQNYGRECESLHRIRNFMRRMRSTREMVDTSLSEKRQEPLRPIFEAGEYLTERFISQM